MSRSIREFFSSCVSSAQVGQPVEIFLERDPHDPGIPGPTYEIRGQCNFFGRRWPFHLYRTDGIEEIVFIDPNKVDAKGINLEPGDLCCWEDPDRMYVRVPAFVKVFERSSFNGVPEVRTESKIHVFSFELRPLTEAEIAYRDGE